MTGRLEILAEDGLTGVTSKPEETLLGAVEDNRRAFVQDTSKEPGA